MYVTCILYCILTIKLEMLRKFKENTFTVLTEKTVVSAHAIQTRVVQESTVFLHVPITGLLQRNKLLKNQRWGNVCGSSLDSCLEVVSSEITFSTNFTLSENTISSNVLG